MAINECQNYCSKCGRKIDIDAKYCPFCGFPNENVKTVEKKETDNKNIKRTICTVLAVICIFYGVFYARYLYTDYKINEIRNNAIKVVDRSSDLLIDVWYNSIWKQSDKDTDRFTCPEGYFLEDFNDALDNLYEDKKFNEDLEEINEVMNQLISLRKNLRWAPIGKDDYNRQLIIMTDCYIDECDEILSPDGSLNEISTRLSELTNKGNKAVSRMEKMF